MKYTLKDIIPQLEKPDLSTYKKYTPLFIKEAQKGLNWTEWKDDVFKMYFEEKRNGVASLGQGVMKTYQKEAVKANWMRLAPHLQAIAKSQNTPLWEEYEKVRKIVRECTKDNMRVATNRMLAGLQPNLLCTEVDIERVNKLIDYIQTYTDAKLPPYDKEKWESASHALLTLFHKLLPGRDTLDYAYFPYKLLRFFRAKEETEFVSYWLISSNDEIFNLEECLKESNLVDWQPSFSPKVGDIVFIYRTRPVQRICYMMKVTKINIPYRETINDERFWGEKHEPKSETELDELYNRLELLQKIDSDALHLDKLKNLGMKGVPQGPRRLYGDLLNYIFSAFSISDNDFEELPEIEGLFEGAKKTVVVNQYERNPEIRKRCIAAHGYKCQVCGMDFEKTYGEIGKDFIHVHHKVPISTIGEEYQPDPVNDLVPVCPNCHAMLHRGMDGKVLKVEKLKEIYQERKKLTYSELTPNEIH